jgi:hypothetical protein
LTVFRRAELSRIAPQSNAILSSDGFGRIALSRKEKIHRAARALPLKMLPVPIRKNPSLCWSEARVFFGKVFVESKGLKLDLSSLAITGGSCPTSNLTFSTSLWTTKQLV